eukprot:COSAG04_NODE_1699_length_5892_cov_3.353530_4_plen_106_part_00
MCIVSTDISPEPSYPLFATYTKGQLTLGAYPAERAPVSDVMGGTSCSLCERSVQAQASAYLASIFESSTCSSPSHSARSGMISLIFSGRFALYISSMRLRVSTNA